MKISPAAYQELRTIYLNLSNHGNSGGIVPTVDAYDRALLRFAEFLIKADQVFP